MGKEKELRNKIRGALYGLAIGDAMGATTEFMDAKGIKATHGRVDDLIGGGWLHLAPGEVTDDTEMTICVAEAYAQAKGDKLIFLNNCISNFCDWLARGPKDVGGACRSAIIRNWEEDDPYKWMENNEAAQEQAGRQDLGNGALMRCIYPILCGDIGSAIMQAKLTHNNSLNDELISLYGVKVQYALRGEYVTDPTNSSLLPPTGHIENTFNNALYWAEHTDNFRDSILGPVNHGGDADTIAAITGGLTGALYGFGSIPLSWVSKLDMEVRIAIEYLVEAAMELTTLK